MRVQAIATVALAACLAGCATSSGGQGTAPRSVTLTVSDYQDRLHAAWVGQVLGMLMGLPFEHEVASVERVEQITERYKGTVEAHDVAPVDDDWYYEMVALNGFERYGIDMTVDELGAQWVENSAGTWGSSYYARKALLAGVPGKDVGHPKHNPAWWTIGPAFSTDLYGLVAPGRPNLAARLARELGAINGYAEGVDGAVFVAGMVSLGFVEKDPQKIVRQAAQLVDPESPYRHALDEVIQLAEEGKDAQTIADIIEDKWHGLYPATNNAVANGGMLAIGMWFGRGDFVETMTIISQVADWEDTDCNAASAAAVLGAMNGLAGIPKALVEQFGDRMVGDKLGEVVLTPAVDTSFTELAKRTVAVGLQFLKAEGMQVTDTEFTVQTQRPEAHPLPRFQLADLTQHWNADWKLERAGFGPLRYFLRGTFLLDDALVTYPKNEARGVVLRRNLKLGGSPRLQLEVGTLPGRAWELEIYVQNKRVVAKRIVAPAVTDRQLRKQPVWQPIDVALTGFEGQEVQVRLYQNLLMTDAVPGSAYWRNVRID